MTCGRSAFVICAILALVSVFDEGRCQMASIPESEAPIALEPISTETLEEIDAGVLENDLPPSVESIEPAAENGIAKIAPEPGLTEEDEIAEQPMVEVPMLQPPEDEGNKEALHAVGNVINAHGSEYLDEAEPEATDDQSSRSDDDSGSRRVSCVRSISLIVFVVVCLI